MLLNFVVKSSLINEEITCPRFIFYEYFTTSVFQFTKKNLKEDTGTRIVLINSKEHLKQIRTVPVTVHSLQGFLNYWLVFFLCKFWIGGVFLFIEVVVVVKSSLINEEITMPVFLLRVNNKARVFHFRRKFLFSWRGNNKARVFFTRILRCNYANPYNPKMFFNFVVKYSLVYEEITRPLLFYEDFTRKICKSL